MSTATRARTGAATAAPAGPSTDLPGLADLAARIASAASAGDVLVVVEGEGTYGYAHTGPCTPARRIGLGRDLLTVPPHMAGVLAHEVAHHALGHLDRPDMWATVQRWALRVAVAALVAGGYLPAVRLAALALAGVAALVCVAALLLDAGRDRRDEYEADAHAVQLLDALGHDGRAATAASLRPMESDPWWYRAVGWLAGTHPTPAARLRRIEAAQ